MAVTGFAISGKKQELNGSQSLSWKRFPDAGKVLVGTGERCAVDHILRLMTSAPVYLRWENGFQAYGH